MEDNEDEPDDVRTASPVEEEITRGEIDEHSGRTAAPVEPGRRRHHCEKDSAKKPKKSQKDEGECCREKLARAAGLPTTARFLVYEKECTLPKIKPIPRHCLTKEEWLDILATPNRRCPPPCLQREVTRKIRPVSTRLAELARPPKNRLLNTLQDRAGTLPTELVDHLIQTIEGEACLTPEQAERMFRDKDIRSRKKCRKRKNKMTCKADKTSKHDRTSGATSNASPFDREAVNCQYLMAESFVRSILDWKCPIPREEFQDIAEVILQRLCHVLEYKPVNGEDRKSQQMRFLADIVASWISGVLFDVAEARKAELEEECERRRRAKEEESDEDSDDESDEEVDRRDDDDDDDEEKDDRKKKRERPPKKKKDDKGKKGRKGRKDDDDDDEDDKLGRSAEKGEGEGDDKDGGDGDEKPETEGAEEKFKEDDETEPAGGDVEEKDAEKDSGEEYHDARGAPGLSPEETDIPVKEAEETDVPAREAEETEQEIKSGEDSQDQKSPNEKPDEEPGKEEEIVSEAQIEQPDAAVVDVSESLAETKETEAAVTAIDEQIVPEELPIEDAEKVDEEDQPAIESAETKEMAAGDRQDGKELPIEPIEPTPEATEIPETKEKEIPVETPSIGAGDQEKEIQAEKDLKVVEEPPKIIETQPKAGEKRERPRRKPTKIPSSVTLVGRKKLQTDAPFVTFDKIFHTIYSAIESSRENPGKDAITNRLHRAVYEKCSSVVQDDRPEPLPELTKDVLDVMSGKIALWLRDILTESQLSFMDKFPATVESTNVREWSKWIGDVFEMTDTWSTWIQKTITQAMRSGNVTRGDWVDWTKSVQEDALLWRRFYLQSLHQAHQNNMMIRDRQVVKTGTRDLNYDDWEREMKITDLETER